MTLRSEMLNTEEEEIWVRKMLSMQLVHANKKKRTHNLCNSKKQQYKIELNQLMIIICQSIKKNVTCICWKISSD